MGIVVRSTTVTTVKLSLKCGDLALQLVMFDTICTLPLQSDLFAQVIHPSEPLFAVGLSSGHVQAYKLPSDADAIDSASQDSSESPTKTTNLINGHGSAPLTSSLRRSSSASVSESGLGSIYRRTIGVACTVAAGTSARHRLGDLISVGHKTRRERDSVEGESDVEPSR